MFKRDLFLVMVSGHIQLAPLLWAKVRGNTLVMGGWWSESREERSENTVPAPTLGSSQAPVPPAAGGTTPTSDYCGHPSLTICM